MHLVGHSVVEEELRGELETAGGARIGPNLEMNVNRAALVPAGIDRREAGEALRVGDLVPA